VLVSVTAVMVVLSYKLVWYFRILSSLQFLFYIMFHIYFDVLLIVHLSIILVINQLNAQHFCFTISLVYASICFEQYVLIIRTSKLYYTASGIIKPVGGRPVHRLREDSPLSTCERDGHLQVWWYQMLYNTIFTSWKWAHSARNMYRYIINLL